MKIFYHNDLDGWCAGYIVGQKFNLTDKNDFFEIKYGDEFPFDRIKKDEEVYIVDYHLELDQMDKLLDITSNVTMVDHHITAYNKYKKYNRLVNKIMDMNYSGCVLTYMHLYNVSFEEVPQFIKYIGDRDIWKFEFYDTKDFCSGAELYDLYPLSEDWEQLKVYTEEVIDEGVIVNKYKAQRNKEYLKQFGYPAVFEGKQAFVINLGLVGSEVFDSMEMPEIGIMYVHDGEKYKISLRSETVNVGELAELHGGGGHFGAAGYECTDLPWKVEK